MHVDRHHRVLLALDINQRTTLGRHTAGTLNPMLVQFSINWPFYIDSGIDGDGGGATDRTRMKDGTYVVYTVH